MWNETETKQFGRPPLEIFFQFYFSFILHVLKKGFWTIAISCRSESPHHAGDAYNSLATTVSGSYGVRL